MTLPHQYIERYSGQVRTEQLFGDRLVRFLYHPLREQAPTLFRLLTSGYSSRLLALAQYDLDTFNPRLRQPAFLRQYGIDLAECLEPERLTSARRLFERRIRYWHCRPMAADERAVVAPADARLLLASLAEDSALWLKDKFFVLAELLAATKTDWLGRFAAADVAIFRLTPEKYHYNHLPVSGRIVDQYEVQGRYHACNPGAVVAAVTPYDKNRRLVTLIDTDVADGSQVGLVAMVEVVALMIGDLHSCYCDHCGYEPVTLQYPGLFVRRGQPKSLFRPGSSTVVLLFEPGRLRFSDDLLANQRRGDVVSRFSRGFGLPLVETEVRLRSTIGRAVTGG
ncbi:phosphatidylserine decarboxylase [Desulfuromonas thiophila]|uniref:phosphatidylserine decarboxylase n=1 Tax=Desulfuromonas thiophila TaxID=57664 RepID=UPI0029F46F79|nr:phosphatidylserine decarboxylase [Desulfuromonas thiophila]